MPWPSVATVGEAASSPSRSRAAATLCMLPMLSGPRARGRTGGRCGRRADAPSPRRRIACMVAESNPARRRADSSTRRPARRRLRLGHRGRRAGALLAGAVAAPLAASAGVDPAASLQAAWASGRHRLPDRMPRAACLRAGSMQAVDDEDSGLRVRVAPTIATTVSFGGARGHLGRDRERHRGGPRRRASCASCARASAIDDQAALDDWLVPDVEGGDGHLRRRTCRSPRASRAASPPAAPPSVSFTVPGEAFADLGGIARRRPRRRTPSSATRSSPPAPAAYANADVPAAGSVAVALAAPLTAPDHGRCRRPHRARPARELDGPHRAAHPPARRPRRSARGDRHRPAHHRLDPRARRRARRRPATRGCSGSPRCRTRCSRSPTPTPTSPCRPSSTFPSCSTPTSFSDALDPANFAADDGGDTTDDGGAPATDQRSSPSRRPAACRPPSELLDWPYTRTDLAWPADDTVAVGDLAYFDAAGLTTALLAPGNAEPIEAPAPSSATIDGSTAARRRRRPHRAAARGIRCLDRRRMAAGDRRTARRTGARRGRGAHDRARHVRPRRRLAVRPGGRGHRRHRRIRLVLARRPVRRDRRAAEPTARWSTCPRPTSGVTMVGRAVQAEADVTEFATVLDDPAQLTGPTRRELMSLLDVAWLADREAWNATVSDWLATQRAVLGSVSVVPSSTINVVSTETGVPTTIENTLPYPVTVVVDVDPSNGRLIVEDRVEATVEPQSRSTVRVPVAAGVGNGEVSLEVSLSSTSGVPVGDPVVIPANVQADWEGLGAAVIAAIVGPRVRHRRVAQHPAPSSASGRPRRRPTGGDGSEDARHPRPRPTGADEPEARASRAPPNRRPSRRACGIRGPTPSPRPRRAAPIADARPRPTTDATRRMRPVADDDRIGRASVFLASGTIVSRVLGFVKAIVLAAAIGVVGSSSRRRLRGGQRPAEHRLRHRRRRRAVARCWCPRSCARAPTPTAAAPTSTSSSPSRSWSSASRRSSPPRSRPCSPGSTRARTARSCRSRSPSRGGACRRSSSTGSTRCSARCSTPGAASGRSPGCPC